MNIKKQHRNFGLVILLCLQPAFIFAADYTKTVNGSARVVPPITLTNLAADCLDFGSIAKGTTSTQIVLSAAQPAAITYPIGDAQIIGSTTPRAAMFTIGGEEGKAYTIELPTTTYLTSGINTPLSLTDFTCSKPITGIAVIGPSGSGTNDFYVGATLTLPSTAASGLYSGTISVTVAYF